MFVAVGEAVAVGDVVGDGLAVVVGETVVVGDAVTVGEGDAVWVGDGVGLVEVHPAAAKIKAAAAKTPSNFFFISIFLLFLKLILSDLELVFLILVEFSHSLIAKIKSQ